MSADLVVQPIDEIRAAVETLAAGLCRGAVFTPETWDVSVSSLARCHDQVGGDTRRQLYEIFGGCSEVGVGLTVADRLERLRRHLR
jgi:hypothetical protein